MRVTAIVSAAFILLSELGSAKELNYRPRGLRWRRNLDDEMRRAAFDMLDGELERRQTGQSSATSSTSIPDMNATIATACVDGLSGITSVSNQAGVTACYNILSTDLSQNTFSADLRLYRSSPPSGPFTNIQSGNMMVSLTYAPSTTFESVIKKRALSRRQTSSITEMDQYSLTGHILPTMDPSKLNQTELLSLMVPAISLNSVDSTTQKPISTNVSTTDMAYFVVGEFRDQFTSAIMTPSLQKFAIRASTKFVLPGVTLGIFPTGLIVTGAWLVLFVFAYGIGTLGRFRHRRMYRARKAAVGARVGKRF